MAKYKSKEREKVIKLQCKDCKRYNYYTHKKKTIEKKLEVKKHCQWCRSHTAHKETKK